MSSIGHIPFSQPRTRDSCQRREEVSPFLLYIWRIRHRYPIVSSELAAYHINSASQSRSSAATYLLSGEVRSPERCYDVENSMDVDIVHDGDLSLDGEEGDDGEDVPQTQIMLVGERDLEGMSSVQALGLGN